MSHVWKEYLRVRDREAPVSNPGPSTKIRIRSRRHGWCRQGAVSGWPPGGQELVAPPTQQKGLGAQRLVERHLGRLVATLAADTTNPAAEPETLDAGRVLDDSVERDVLADYDLSHFGSPSRWR